MEKLECPYAPDKVCFAPEKGQKVPCFACPTADKAQEYINSQLGAPAEEQNPKADCDSCKLADRCKKVYEEEELPPCGAIRAKELFAASFIELLNWINDIDFVEIGAIRFEPLNADNNILRVAVVVDDDKRFFDEEVDKYGSNIEDVIFKIRSRICQTYNM